MSYWTDTAAGREGLSAWEMDRADARRADLGEYCPVCGFLLAAHQIDACPTETEVREWFGDDR